MISADPCSIIGLSFKVSSWQGILPVDKHAELPTVAIQAAKEAMLPEKQRPASAITTLSGIVQIKACGEADVI